MHLKNKLHKLIRILSTPSLFGNYAFFLGLYIVLLTTALIPYYTHGCLILGGEADCFLDFKVHLKYIFTWFPMNNTGVPNMTPPGTGLNILLLCLIEKLTGNASITNFVLIFSIYFFPFLAMYLVCKEIKATPFISFVCSLFYVINPFTLYYLINLNQGCAFSLSAMPIFLWIILRYYHSNFKLFFLFGFISACFSFTYSNIPTFVIIHLSIVLSTFIVSYYYNKKFIPTETFKKYWILLVSFIVFNSWWILSFIALIPSAQKLYTRSFAHSWLNATVGSHSPVIAKMFSFTTIIWANPGYDFFTDWYSTIFAKLITLVPIFMVVYFVLIVKDKRTRNLLNCLLFAILLIVLFFVKGNASPFGFIYEFMFKYFPFFYIFKSPTEKFGILYVFIFSVLLLFVMSNIKNYRYCKSIVGIFIVYLIFCSIPIITGNIIPDYKKRGYLGDNRYASRKYKDKMEYKQFREEVNSDISEYRILSLPGSANYQVCMLNWNNRYYTGWDPVLMNINKPFVASYTDVYVSNLLFQNISLINYKKLLGIYNIRKIIINEDLFPWFGFVERESIPELKNIFGKFMTSKKWGPITLYDNKDDFLPLIYVSPSSKIDNKK